jgi:hypothetical protein
VLIEVKASAHGADSGHDRIACPVRRNDPEETPMTDLAQRRRQLEDRLQTLDAPARDRGRARQPPVEGLGGTGHRARGGRGSRTPRRVGSGRNRPHPRRAEADGRGRIRLLHEMRKRDLAGAPRPAALDPVLQDMRHLTGGSRYPHGGHAMGVRPSDHGDPAPDRGPAEDTGAGRAVAGHLKDQAEDWAHRAPIGDLRAGGWRRSAASGRG